MEKKNYIVAIDLGDSNVVVAVGSPSDDGTINIECIVSKPSDGVSAGKIVNIELAGNAINAAIEEVRRTTGFEIYEAYAGISGEFVYCTGYTDHVFVPDYNNGVTQQDVKALFDRMSNVQVSDEKYIMERIPQSYVVDNTIEVKNPVGSFGNRLSSTFNFIISENTPLQRLDLAMRRQNIKLRRSFSNAVVVGDAVLSPDEMEEGVAVVDIGGGLTNVAIYYRNVVRYISTIPMGADAINNDIRTLMIPERYIESLKQRYGYALAEIAPDDVKVTVKGRTKRDSKDIIIYNLATVIEARAKDIAEFVKQEIKDSNFAGKLPYGIVLTGGSAQLRGLDKLFAKVTGLDVRVAEAEDVISAETREKITSSADSVTVGLLLNGLKHGFCDVELKEIPAPVEKVEPKKVVPPTPPIPTQRPVVTPQPVVPPNPYKSTQQEEAKPEPPKTAPRTIGGGVQQPKSINDIYADRQSKSEPPAPIAEPAPQAVEPIADDLLGDEAQSEESTGKQKGRLDFKGIFGNIVSKVNKGFDLGEDEDI